MAPNWKNDTGNLMQLFWITIKCHEKYAAAQHYDDGTSSRLRLMIHLLNHYSTKPLHATDHAYQLFLCCLGMKLQI